MHFLVDTNSENMNYTVEPSSENGVSFYTFNFFSDELEHFHKMKIEFEIPIKDIHCYWTPGQFGNRSLQTIWRDWGGFESKSTTYAPIGTLYNINNTNKKTIALSDAINTHQFAIGLSEENKTVLIKLFLLTEKMSKRTSYSVVLRIDDRPIPFYKAIQYTTLWYENFYPPMHVPNDCFFPMYSTWYSFHQNFTALELEEECKLFADYGFKSIIVDDGWQTDDSTRGYAYCGDWKHSKKHFPDIYKHIEFIHSLKMNYLLWFAVPFIGYQSEIYHSFKNKFLYEIEELRTGVLDIRYAEVKDYLIETYTNAVKEYKLDGLKLDFVDCFSLKDNTVDLGSLQESFNHLFLELIQQLLIINPNIMIEFRQNYIGPSMRQYGNIFRASDCPSDFIQNRVRTTDLRLLSGTTAVHSDMLMWSNKDTVESAALQIINILFSVPQVSVRYDALSPLHKKMLKHWLEFWFLNKDILLSQDFRAFHPELNYTLLQGKKDNKIISFCASSTLIKCDEYFVKHTIINGTGSNALLLSLFGNYTIYTFNTLGELLLKHSDLYNGILEFDVPLSGYIIIEKNNLIA